MAIDNFVRSVSKIASGAVVGQLALLASMSVSTALYAPEALGALGLVASAAAIGEVLLGLRLDLAFPVCKDDRAFSRLANVVERQVRFGVAAGFAVGAVCLGVFGRQAITAPEKAVVSIAVLSAAGALFFDARVLMAIRQRSFSRVGQAQAVSGVSQASLLVLLGFVAPEPFLAASTFLFARAIAAHFVLRTQVPADEEPRLTLAKAASEYPSFVRFSMPTGIVSSVNLAIPLSFFAATFDVALAGVFFLVWRLLVGPAQLIGRSIGQVVYGETAAGDQIAGIRNKTLHSVRRTVPLGAALVLVAAVARAAGIERLLSDAWVDVRSFVVPVSVIAATQLMSSPVRNVLTRLGRQGQLLVLQIARLLLSVGAALLALVLDAGEVESTWLFAAAFFLANGLVLVATVRLLDSLDQGRRGGKVAWT